MVEPPKNGTKDLATRYNTPVTAEKGFRLTVDITKRKFMAANAKVTIQPNIDDESASRLEARGYDKAWTAVPNRVLSTQVKAAWTAFYKLMGLGEFDSEGSIYTVRAVDGVYKGIVAPSIFRDATYPEDGEGEPVLMDSLVLRIGNKTLPLSMTLSQMLPGVKGSIRTVKNGKWEEVAVVAAFKEGSTLYTFQFPIRSANWEEKLDPDTLESLLEEENIQAFLDLIQPLPNPSPKKGDGAGRFLGHFVKVAHFPVGTYKAVAYRSRTTDYGMDYMVQIKLEEPFVAPAPRGEEEEILVDEWVIMKPNAALKRVLGAKPTITPENPAFITILELGEWNGHPTAKLKVEIPSFEKEEEALDLNF
jgi:hypothetical protein